MALAFPKTNATVLAPLGAAALFWAWFGLSPMRAFWVGWVAGTVFFAIDFWWFGETAGALVAPFGFTLALGPAIGDAFFGFGLVGALVALAARALGRRDRLARALVPLGAAAIFAVGEWLRSEGLGQIGVPFGSLGFTQLTSPLVAVAAVAGTYGVTFVVCAIGAYGAYAVRMRAVRGSGIDTAVSALGILVLVALAWVAWPARHAPTPHVRVAAIQGNIPQSLKFTRAAFDRAIARYEALTLQAAVTHPAIIVWPETVITAALNTNLALRARFAALAKRAQSEVVVGTFYVEGPRQYNVLYFFRPDGGLDAIYRKRQLVPFAEHVPFGSLVDWLPWARNVSHFSAGTDDGLVAVESLHFGPIVCWESAFTDLVGDDVRNGATALIVATDDAWFGTTAGPYQHAQIAQMRAIETGRWIVRAASTGISGLISPAGRYTRATALEQTAVVTGVIGEPVDTPYDRIGGNVVAFLLAVGALAIVAWGNRSGVRSR
ncbi:MAG: apolipoprotein N-acyltransferase [Vulcanimicrobiaceae bacterium]